MKRLLIFLLLVSGWASATTYYVSVADGNNTNCDGTHSTAYTSGSGQPCPYKTIAKVNGLTLAAGDSVLFKKGEIWRETLTVPSSGSAGNVITFDAYGSGAAPIITGSNVATSWTTESQGSFNAYYKTYAGVEPYVVTSDGTFLWRNQTSAASLALGQFFWDATHTRVYVRLPGDDAPSGHTMEVGQRDYAVVVNAKNYVTVQNLELDGANAYIAYVYGGSDHFSLLSNTIKNGGEMIWGDDQWRASVYVTGATNSLIQGNTVSYGTIGIFHATPAGQTNNSNTTRLNTVSHVGYAGIAVSNPTSTNFLVELNDCSYANQNISDASCLYTNATGTGGIIRYNRVHNNGTATTNSAGIMIDTNSSATKVYGNVIWLSTNGCIDDAGTGSYFYGNTCYHNNESTADVGEFNPWAATSTWKNNIAVASTGKHVLMAYVSSGLTLDYNLYYGGISTPFTCVPYYDLNLADYQNDLSQDLHSAYADPKFTNAAGGDFTLQATSPAIGKGVNLGATYNSALDPKSTLPWRTEPQCAAWNIGAFGQQGCGSALWFGIP